MRGAKEAVISAASFIVFSFLDFADLVLCFFYRFVDSVLEENPAPCFCRSRGEKGRGIADDEGGNGEISETLYGRKSAFKETGFILRKEDGGDEKEKNGGGENEENGGRGFRRWSDCGCETCFPLGDWEGEKQKMLHLVTRETIPAEETQVLTQNVIFLHGFMSSSSLWVESVFPNLSEDSNIRFKLFAVDLLGFGKSPKPANCSYTVSDHLEMIDKSVIKRFGLDSFHIVAHSMGCILALALAAKFPNSTKSITLVAPPYFPSDETKSSYRVLNRIAERKIWPPPLFGRSVMSWYEHLGRTVCLVICKNHSTLEWLIKLLTWKRELHFTLIDATKHTHQSAWLTMHNVICGGGKMMDVYLNVLKKKEILIKIIQGSKDQLVPLECSLNMKARVPQAKLQIIYNADHSTVILDRKESFTRDLEKMWSSSNKSMKC